MIKKIDANKYGVVRYAISSIEDIADLPREVSVGSEAILVNEDGEKKFRLGSDGWVEVVEVKEYDEDKLRDILEDAKVGYGGIEYETLEERLDKDFDNAYSVLDNRTYIEYEGCRITAEDSLNGLQKETVVKGRTFQNLLSKMELRKGLSFNNGVYETNPTINIHTGFNTLGMIKNNTKYSLIIEFLEIPTGITAINLLGTNEFGYNYRIYSPKTNTRYVTTSTSRTDEVVSILYFGIAPLDITEPIKFKAVLLEGDHTQTPLEELPFIEGIESVGDKTNKSRNLCDNIWESGRYTIAEGIPFNDDSAIRTVNFINCKPSTTYTLTTYNGDKLYNINEYNNGVFIKATQGRADDQITRTITTSKTTNQINISMKVWSENTVIQFEEGEVSTPYQEYCEGYKISGKSCGKNLIDFNKLIYGYYYNPTTGELTANNYACCSEFLKYNKQNIIISGVYDQASSCVCYFDINYNYIGRTTANPVSGYKLTVGSAIADSSYRGHVVPANVAYLAINFYRNSSFNGSVTIDMIKENLKCLQIEENSVATPYEPYKESTYSYILDEPLRSLPNGVCDEIDLEKGIVTRRVGKVVLDENEVFVDIPSISNTLTNCMCFGVSSRAWDKPMIPTPTRATSIVSKIPYIADNTDVFHWRGSDGVFEGVSYGTFMLFIEKTKLTTLDSVGVSEWLSKNNIEIVYQLLTPTTEYLIKGDKFVTLPNGVKDEISHNSVLRKVGKIVLDGSKVFEGLTGVEGIARWGYRVPEVKLGGSCVCSIFDYVTPAQTWLEPFKDGITVNSVDATIFIYMDKYKEIGRHMEEVKALLDGLEVYYELNTLYTEPINLDEVILDTTRLKSYEPITHITSDNYLQPTIKTQVPSDFNAVVLGLKSNNEALTSQVMSLRQTNDELETTNREQDDVIDVTLLALDEVYGMIDEGEIETMSTGSPMVNVYVKMIKRGIKTLDEVPAKYRAEVEKLI